MADQKAPAKAVPMFLSNDDLDGLKKEKHETLFYLGGGGFVTGKITSYDAASITLDSRNGRHPELIVNRLRICAYAVYPS